MSMQPASPLQRLRRGCYVLGTVAALAVAACSSRGQVEGAVRAASYSAQLGMAYLHRGGLALAKEQLGRALAEIPRDPNVPSGRALELFLREREVALMQIGDAELCI